jgi:hypothetical protein
LPGISQIARSIELLDLPGPSVVDRRVPSFPSVNTLGETLVKQDVGNPPFIVPSFKLQIKQLEISTGCGALLPLGCSIGRPKYCCDGCSCRATASLIWRRDRVPILTVQADIVPRPDRHRARAREKRPGGRHLRLITLTAVSIVLGMIPIAPTVFWGPMAFAIMGGLLVATILTLILLPTLYVAWIKGIEGLSDPHPSSPAWPRKMRIACKITPPFCIKSRSSKIETKSGFLHFFGCGSRNKLSHQRLG